MAPARTPRTSWIEEGLKALAAGGPEAVRVELLAQSLGVSKGGFYWHFDNRQALLAEMLDAWETASIDDVIAHVERTGGDGRAKLRTLFGLAVGGRGLLAADLAVRDWARRDKAVAGRLRRADTRRLDYMRTLFAEFVDDAEEVEARCLVVFALFVSNRLIAADGWRLGRREVVERVLADLTA